MDLVTLFYTVGTVFFIVNLIVILVALYVMWSLYRSFQDLKKQAPMKVIGYLQEHNSESLKALGVSLMGFVIGALKSRLRTR